jgi:hypothetical protein
MSSDNTIVILATTRRWKKDGEYGRTYKQGTTTVYRVAHVQAWDNFRYFRKNEPMLVGSYLDMIFGKSEVYETLEEAYAKAEEIEKEENFVEYGIVQQNFTEFSFLNDYW